MQKLFYMIALCATISAHAVPYYNIVDSFTDEMKEQYEREGFVVIKDFLSEAQCAQLQEEAQRIVSNFDADEHSSIFSADSADQSCKRDAYFFDSADKVHCFLEEKAVVDGKLVVDKNRAINKIGHALHDKNSIFESVTFSPRIVQFAQDVGLLDPLVVQSMFIFKYAEIGAAVVPHQDAIFLYTEPLSLAAFWTAIDEATLENGCLWVVPGSHKDSLKARFVADENKQLSFIEGSLSDCDLPDEAFVPLEVPKGTLVIFDGKLIHKSAPNSSKKDRNAYTFHVMSGTAHYPADNWLQRDDFPQLVVH